MHTPRFHPPFPVVSLLLLSAGLLLPAVAPVTAFAAGPDRKIEVSSEKTPDGQSSVTVVISGIPPEDLGLEGMKALLGYLTGRNLDALVPAAKQRATTGEPAAPAAGADRDQKEFDLELNIHWKRTVEDQQDGAKDESKKPAEPKATGEPKRAGESKTLLPAKVGGTTLDSLKKMISGGPATSDAPAAAETPEAKKGETRRNAAEVAAILRDLGNLQRKMAEQTKSVERARGLAAPAKGQEGPRSPAEMRKVAEAAAELDKLIQEIERRSKEVEQAIDQARARLEKVGPEGAGRPTQKPSDEPKKKRKKPGKPGRPKTVNES